MPDENETKRKLIGFVSGEKGSISKVKALALGATVAGVAGLEEVDATDYEHVDGNTVNWKDDTLGGHSKTDWSNDIEGGTNHMDSSIMTDPTEESGIHYDGGIDFYPEDPEGGPSGAESSWSGDWDNAAPEVEDVE